MQLCSWVQHEPTAYAMLNIVYVNDCTEPPPTPGPAPAPPLAECVATEEMEA